MKNKHTTTLAEHRKLAVRAFGENSEAVKYVDEQIAKCGADAIPDDADLLWRLLQGLRMAEMTSDDD